MAQRGERPLRVLAADDSAVMREILRMVFNMHAGTTESTLPAMELCGVAVDGLEALDAVRRLQPDVLLLDLEMPRLNGLGVLERLRETAPSLPVIMCSAHTERGARATLDALSAGAKDYVMKPAQQTDFAAALDSLMKQLLPRIAALAQVEPHPPGWAALRGGTGLPGPLPSPVSSPVPSPLSSSVPGQLYNSPQPGLSRPGALASSRIELVVIAASTGGPAALEQLLPTLPAAFAVPILIVQHMPKLFTVALAARLNKLCALTVRQAVDGDVVLPGTVLLAPGDAHMEVCQGTAQTRAVRLHQGPALNSCKPSADYLLQSAARLHGNAALAVILTGMGQDGFNGAEAMVEVGGTVLAQDEASSAVWGMPGRVARAGLAAETLPLNRMADEVKRRVLQGRASEQTASGYTRAAQREASHGMY